MSDQDKSVASRIAYWLRDRLSAPLFDSIDVNDCDVLDVGGGSFFLRLRERRQVWRRYVVVEPSDDLLPDPDPSVEGMIGTAEDLPFPDESFDRVLAVQVLEHVFEPIKATDEMYRCLRPGGELIILVPQSGNLHLVPYHFQNFTRFWLFEQARRMGAEITLWKPLGGAWRTIASRLFLLFWPLLDLHETRDPMLRHRPWHYWLLLPFQVVAAVIFFPIALLLSVSDISEEANNHLVVMRKPVAPEPV